jgi:hypothetical protein
MDYLITTTLPDLQEVNTLIIGTTEERMNDLFLELLNQYSVHSVYYSKLSLYEKARILEDLTDTRKHQSQYLYETLKDYERTKENTCSFPT